MTTLPRLLRSPEVKVWSGALIPASAPTSSAATPTEMERRSNSPLGQPVSGHRSLGSGGHARGDDQLHDSARAEP